ncbi:hypothetical protein ACOMHN_036205 [Nucella lapillus]
MFQAKVSNILHPTYQWLVIWTGSETDVLELEGILCCSPSNVALVRPVTSSHLDVINDRHSWLSTKTAENQTTTENTSMPEAVNPLEDAFAVYSYSLADMTFSYVATWTSASRLRVFNDVIFPAISRFFSRAPLRIGALQGIPFTKRMVQNGTVVYGGFCFDIVNAMAKYLNFSYEVIEPPDARFGYEDEDGNWSGMVGMLIRGELDMAVGPFSITPDRMAVVDFTVLYMEDGGGLLTKKDHSKPDLLNVFRPFPLSVWVMITGVVVVAGVVLNITTKLSNYTFYSDECERQDCPKTSWSLRECVMMIFGSLMTQGVSRHPDTCSGRVVLGCWWVFAILIVSMYTASLAALLTVRITSNVNSIQDLAASNLVPVTITGGYWWSLFMKTDAPVYRTVASRMAGAPKIAVREDALKMVYDGTAAYIADMNVVRFLQGQDCKNLHLAATGFNSNGLGFALPKNAYYKEAVNNIILKLQEGGFLAMWEKEWWRGSADCAFTTSTISSAQRLQVVSIGGVLIVYVVVIALALLSHVMQCLLPPCVQAVRQCWKDRGYHVWGCCGDYDLHNDGGNSDKDRGGIKGMTSCGGIQGDQFGGIAGECIQGDHLSDVACDCDHGDQL